MEEDQHMVAAAQHILKALASSKTVSHEMRKTLLDLEIQLSTINERKGSGIKQLERKLKCLEDKVMSLEKNDSVISSEYLKLVDEIQTLQQKFDSLNENWKQKELVQKSNEILQVVMLRLEEELVQILVNHKQYFEVDYMSFNSNRVDLVYDESFGSVEDERINKVSRSIDDSLSEASNIDLVNPSVVEDLKSIAKAMFGSNYQHEFCHVFISSRRDALDEYFVILEIERLSIENMLKMEWQSLNRMIKKWIRAMKFIVQAYLVGEKRLCKQILGDFGSVYQYCFSEISRSSVLHLLNFGEAIAMGTHTPEKLFCLLDMYEALEHVAVDKDFLFIEEIDSFVTREFHNLQRFIVETIKSTFLSFRNAIATNPSKKCFPCGGVHPLTKYVMNYINALVEYGDSLNLLVDETSTDQSDSNDENNYENSTVSCSPLACNLRLITTTLESNLCNKSKLYNDVALQHIFMMNNIHYMVQKVKSSNLCNFFGDLWLRRHVGMFQHYARSYEKVSWSSVLSFLRDESLSTCVTERKIKKKCKDFSAAFGEVYKTQTGWSVPDKELREDLQISVSQKVIPAYRSYTGRHSSKIDEKWIKYTVDDLQCYILDLFQGSSKSLHHSHHRK
ncbi:exocyst complex component [Trifolium pratense]|uniref:Exocyst subunit Exo70 family protein n=1 Tax=Trifolium pratense TaxID=57577 RepID=A0A2K3P631_TRIPR|nr:exocyst complex component [Trifolium pratense]